MARVNENYTERETDDYSGEDEIALRVRFNSLSERQRSQFSIGMDETVFADLPDGSGAYLISFGY